MEKTQKKNLKILKTTLLRTNRSVVFKIFLFKKN